MTIYNNLNLGELRNERTLNDEWYARAMEADNTILAEMIAKDLAVINRLIRQIESDVLVNVNL